MALKFNLQQPSINVNILSADIKPPPSTNMEKLETRLLLAPSVSYCLHNNYMYYNYYNSVLNWRNCS